MSRPHLTKKQARTCKSVQKIIKTRFFVDNHEILLYFNFIDIISSSERLAAGKESGLNEQVERRQLSKCDYVAQELKTQIIAGKYRSGDQLPPEPALCEMFSVSRITVRGEVSNCKYHTSGHIYFTLKDGTGTLAAVMFAGYDNKMAKEDCVYLLMNPYWEGVWVELPQLPGGYSWHVAANTGDKKQEIYQNPVRISEERILVGPRSVIVLEADQQ